MSDNKSVTLDNDTISTAPQNTITAVDIVLEPDETMIQHAQAANAGLLKNFPKGYALGDEHAPHISVWMPCSLSRFLHSRFRSWECPPTSSAILERLRNNSTPSS